MKITAFLFLTNQVYLTCFLQTRQKLDELKGSLDEVTSKLEKISASLLEEFYNKMQRGAEQLQEKLGQQHTQLMHYIDGKIENQARKHADSARDQAAEIHLKVNNLLCL